MWISLLEKDKLLFIKQKGTGLTGAFFVYA
jgi:hypothetical protein